MNGEDLTTKSWGLTCLTLLSAQSKKELTSIGRGGKSQPT